MVTITYANNSITILGKLDGRPKSGYTVKLYKYSTAHSTNNFYSNSTGLLGAFIDNSDGTYYITLDTDTFGVVVITTPSTTSVIVPTNYIGKFFDGKNKLTIPPASST